MKMNICFISDQKFLHYAKTMVNSLLQNNASHEIHLFLVSDDVTQADADAAFASVLIPNASLTVIRVTAEDIGNIKTDKRFGHYVYYRIFFYKFFPKDISAILSLDVDMIITGDLSPIFETKLDEFALAACVDAIPTCGSIFSRQQLDRYDLDADQTYYNAGMMLMNLDKMRIEDKGEQMLQVGLQDSTLGWPEQDLINIFYKGEIFKLPRRYNHATLNHITNNEEGVAPVILHYLGARKPDHYKYEGGYLREYWKYVVDRPGKLWMAAYWIKRTLFFVSCPMWRVPMKIYYAIKKAYFS